MTTFMLATDASRAASGNELGYMELDRRAPNTRRPPAPATRAPGCGSRRRRDPGIRARAATIPPRPRLAVTMSRQPSVPKPAPPPRASSPRLTPDAEVQRARDGAQMGVLIAVNGTGILGTGGSDHWMSTQFCLSKGSRWRERPRRPARGCGRSRTASLSPSTATPRPDHDRRPHQALPVGSFSWTKPLSPCRGSTRLPWRRRRG